MRVLLIDNGTKWLQELQRLIPGGEITQRWNNIDRVIANGYDLVILSGSSDASVVWHHESFVNEIDIIRSGAAPIIGICFGCELIAHTFGGTLRELAEPHHGIRTISILGNDLFEQDKIEVYEHHRWIIDELPNELIVLARSDDGPEAIMHRDLPIYGLQFHPEHLAEKTLADTLFLKLLEKITNS